MPINLLKLLGKFESVSNRETAGAYFQTHVPAVGSDAYLNIVYKAAPMAVVREVDRDIRLPASLIDFYTTWNGARLFVGALSIYGCLSIGQTLDRTDPYKLLPFDLRAVNQEFAMRTTDLGLLCIGSYSFDRSIICMRRKTQSVICFVGKHFSKVRMEWTSLELWLTEEIARISLLFDEKGNRLVEKDHLLPGLEPPRVI